MTPIGPQIPRGATKREADAQNYTPNSRAWQGFFLCKTEVMDKDGLALRVQCAALAGAWQTSGRKFLSLTV